MKRSAFLRSALALLLCLTMVLSFVPVQAAAEVVEQAAAYDCAQNDHNYKAGTFRATCEQYPRTHYTCTYCGDNMMSTQRSCIPTGRRPSPMWMRL